jgi:DNA-binding transcriptional ArsR family regulator
MAEEEAGGPQSAGARRRTLADAPSLQALAHPTRLALIEAIGLSGSLTATQASRLVGESPTACAYHLRMLARRGFIEEAGQGTGRERPWRLAQAGLEFDPDSDDPEVARAADALSTVVTERFISRIRGFELARSRFPEDVRAATGTMQSVVFATPAEMQQLREEILTLMCRYLERLDPRLRPPGSQPFELVMFSHILEAAGEGAGSAEAAADT